jgi:hypothetical protein
MSSLPSGGRATWHEPGPGRVQGAPENLGWHLQTLYVFVLFFSIVISLGKVNHDVKSVIGIFSIPLLKVTIAESDNVSTTKHYTRTPKSQNASALWCKRNSKVANRTYFWSVRCFTSVNYIWLNMKDDNVGKFLPWLRAIFQFVSEKGIQTQPFESFCKTATAPKLDLAI